VVHDKGQLRTVAYDHYDLGMARVSPGILPVIAVDRTSDTPLHRQVYEGYREAIVSRRLRAGQRVPSTRGLARELRLSRISALAAFEQLLAEGYFESRRGAGTFVAASLPDAFHESDARPSARKARDRPGARPVARGPEVLLRREPEPWLAGRGPFRLSQPAVDHFPFAVWSRLVARHSRNPRAKFLQYGDPMGDARFREAIAAYLRTARAVRCEARSGSRSRVTAARATR
jgi:GntR family transcriptional regulator/MocR family aminotransferase